MVAVLVHLPLIQLDVGPCALFVWVALQQDLASGTLGGLCVPLNREWWPCKDDELPLIVSWTDGCSLGRGPDEQGPLDQLQGHAAWNHWQLGVGGGVGPLGPGEEGAW